MSVAPVQSPPLWSLRKLQTASLLLFITSLISSILKLEEVQSSLSQLGSVRFYFKGVTVPPPKPPSPASVVRI